MLRSQEVEETTYISDSWEDKMGTDVWGGLESRLVLYLTNFYDLK